MRQPTIERQAESIWEADSGGVEPYNRAMLHRLENQIQNYAWGSPSALPELYGVENPSGAPMAELWMGAHPKAPSRLPDLGGIGLDHYISEEPGRSLGGASVHERLPFLFKILCAETPLSIQAHPSLEQARAGFARDEAAGLDRGAPNRNYRDDNHKPELICAVTPFWALRGFRPIEEISGLWSSPEFREADSPLLPPQSEADLGRFFKDLLELERDARSELIAAAISISRSIRPHRNALPEAGDPNAAHYWVQTIADHYPGDVGILSPLILNTISLRPGEVTYQPAGVLHAYLHGVGAELMANSDNVLRGGMTPKHLDPNELLRVGVFRSEPPAVLTGDTEDVPGGTCVRYSTPFDEFAFDRYLFDGGPDKAGLREGTAQIVFCHRGSVSLECRIDPGRGDGGSSTAAAERATIVSGQALFVDAATREVYASADEAAELFVARVP